VEKDEKTAVIEKDANLAEAEEAKTPAAAAKPATPDAPPAAKPIRQQVELDDSKASVCYGNFCRVTGTPEEIILDFGLNPQPFGTPTSPIQVSQRLVVNFFTAKRLLAALSMTVERHEQTFGVLETDVNKRVRPELRNK